MIHTSTALCAALGLIVLGSTQAATESWPVETLTLENAQLSLTLTPTLGGRVLSFAKPGRANLLKVGAPLYQGVQPEISPFAENIGYLGHIVWLAPQSQWWSRQQLNPARAEAQANWPPDPYLIFATNQVTQQANEIQLQGSYSPISGVQLNKTFTLHADHLELTASAMNPNTQSVSWGLWFNSRIHPNATVYLPVTDASAIHQQRFAGDPAPLQTIDTVTVLQASPTTKAEGKLFIQPTAGWLAARDQQQLWLITYKLTPAAQVAPGQAPLEIYYKLSGHSDNGLIELEFHSPYQVISQTSPLTATSRWYLFDCPSQWSDEQVIRWLGKEIDARNIRYD